MYTMDYLFLYVLVLVTLTPTLLEKLFPLKIVSLHLVLLSTAEVYCRLNTNICCYRCLVDHQRSEITSQERTTSLYVMVCITFGCRLFRSTYLRFEV